MTLGQDEANATMRVKIGSPRLSVLKTRRGCRLGGSILDVKNVGANIVESNVSVKHLVGGFEKPWPFDDGSTECSQSLDVDIRFGIKIWAV